MGASSSSPLILRGVIGALDAARPQEPLPLLNPSYFRLDHDFQCVFVLHGLGGSGKSQLAFKFMWESTWYGSTIYEIMTGDNLYFSFSASLMSSTLTWPINKLFKWILKPSVHASLHWLASQCEGNWLLFFDNADDVNLKLKKFFPSCVSGNILVTTCNRELCHHSARDADAKVMGMDHEDTTNLLLHLAWAEESKKNKALAEAIVQVLSFIFISLETSQTKAWHRSSITLPWLSPKLALTFIATHH
jgi:hypothetical protein